MSCKMLKNLNYENHDEPQSPLNECDEMVCIYQLFCT